MEKILMVTGERPFQSHDDDNVNGQIASDIIFEMGKTIALCLKHGGDYRLKWTIEKEPDTQINQVQTDINRCQHEPEMDFTPHELSWLLNAVIYWRLSFHDIADKEDLTTMIQLNDKIAEMIHANKEQE